LSGSGPARQLGVEAAERAPGRRDCLRAFVSLVGVLSLGSYVSMCAARAEDVNLEVWLRYFSAAYAGDGAELSRLGAIYLASNPHERSRERLSRLLSMDGASSVGSRLIEHIARDWSEHDVTTVDGWLLARTEARICAALHLMHGAPV
jgi:hypothetical protein